MFPPETSLISVTVALARFVQTNGLASMFGHYPHWYLGVPYQYLTGPIVPLLQIFMRQISAGLSLFEITYLLLFLSFLASIVGWGIMVSKISGKRVIGIVAGILLLILPWRYLSTLALSEASTTISKNLLPFALLAFWSFYKKRDRKSGTIAVLTLSFLLLINTSVIAVFAVGLSALILAFSYRKGKVRKVSKKIKSTIILVILSLVLVTLWYTPVYWWTVVGNPSIGGASGIKVFVRIFDLLKASIPLVLAVITVYFSGKIKSKLSVFSLTWTFAFLFLTVFRFIGDPDFWQDWSSWFGELEIGLALLASSVILDLKHSLRLRLRLKILEKKIPVLYYLILASLLIPFYLTWRIHSALGRPQLISNSIPQGVRSLEKLSDVAAGERVFLSGSTVFWAGSTGSPLNQVRGGVDKAATHPFWDHASYQLREGADPELAKAWLESLGVSYVLVHGPASSETYHDFRNIDKWQEVGEIVWTGEGDVIIKVPSSTLAWVADLSQLGKVRQPESGIDLNALKGYLSAKKRLANIKWVDNNQIRLDGMLNNNEGIVIAVSHSNGWKSEDGQVREDSLGNILFIPENYSKQNFVLRYR
jgi:hypothetical protein